MKNMMNYQMQERKFYSKYSIGELLLKDYNYNLFIPPHHK